MLSPNPFKERWRGNINANIWLGRKYGEHTEHDFGDPTSRYVFGGKSQVRASAGLFGNVL
jgi:hypothetical protein